MIVSIVSNISSTVSAVMYNSLDTSTPIASKNSLLTAVSVSINTATPPCFCVSANTCADNNDLPLCSNPVISVILPIGKPPNGLLETATSNIVAPEDTHPVMLVGASSESSSKKNATFWSLYFLFRLSAICCAKST